MEGLILYREYLNKMQLEIHNYSFEELSGSSIESILSRSDALTDLLFLDNIFKSSGLNISFFKGHSYLDSPIKVKSKLLCFFPDADEEMQKVLSDYLGDFVFEEDSLIDELSEMQDFIKSEDSLEDMNISFINQTTDDYLSLEDILLEEKETLSALFSCMNEMNKTDVPACDLNSDLKDVSGSIKRNLNSSKKLNELNEEKESVTSSNVFIKNNELEKSNELSLSDALNKSSDFDEPENLKGSSDFDEPENLKGSSALDELDDLKGSSALDELDDLKSSSALDELDDLKELSALDESENLKESSAFYELDNLNESSDLDCQENSESLSNLEKQDDVKVLEELEENSMDFTLENKDDLDFSVLSNYNRNSFFDDEDGFDGDSKDYKESNEDLEGFNSNFSLNNDNDFEESLDYSEIARLQKSTDYFLKKSKIDKSMSLEEFRDYCKKNKKLSKIEETPKNEDDLAKTLIGLTLGVSTIPKRTQNILRSIKSNTEKAYKNIKVLDEED